MAALVVQSRFAGLKIEDEDHPSSSDSQKSKKNKTNSVKKTITEPQKKIKTVNNNKSQGTTNKKKKLKQGGATSQQWELWKQKDEELVDGNFETDLQQAILLSKLDYEEKKDVYKQIKKESEHEKKLIEQTSKLQNKKQKKKNVMSLEQFNGMANPGEEFKYHHEDEKEEEESKQPEDDTEFFERVKDETKNELLKDKIIDKVKIRLNVNEQSLSRVQFNYALEKKNNEILALKEEVIKLKSELLKVKSRNKQLCNILGQGEMKDKAEILIEVEKLRSVQAELTTEIAILHTELEKERSKNTDPRAKDKKHPSKKKNIRFNVSPEAIPSKESSSGTA